MPSPPTAPVSAIVPTYNRADLIGAAVGSLLDQTRPPAEVIVVDDGSTDDIAGALAPFGDRITLLAKENGGKSTALNAGLARAREPLVWIFDDDDIALPDGLERLHDALLARPDAGFAYGQIDKFVGAWPSPVSPPCITFASDDRRSLYLKLLQDFFIWQGAMLVRRECYEAVGPFDPRYTRSQDYEMALRLMRRFTPVAVPHVIFHQRHHRGDRGPAHARLKAKRMEAVWSEFNRLLFAEVHASHDLAEFVVRDGDGPLDPRERLTAFLQRGAIMARKGAWSLAVEDLGAAALLAGELRGASLGPQEASALRAVFEHGARSRFASRAEARTLRAAIDRFPPPLADEIRGNLLLPVTNRLRRLPARTDRAGEARQLALILAALADAGALRPYLAARRAPYRHFGVDPIGAAS